MEVQRTKIWIAIGAKDEHESQRKMLLRPSDGRDKATQKQTMVKELSLP